MWSGTTARKRYYRCGTTALTEEKANRFLTYGWHWWVICVNVGGRFNDGRPEVIRAFLIGRDKEAIASGRLSLKLPLEFA